MQSEGGRVEWEGDCLELDHGKIVDSIPDPATGTSHFQTSITISPFLLRN